MRIDPLEEDYTYNSTYASTENSVVDIRELEGLEAVRFDKKYGLQNFVVVVKGYSGAQDAGKTQAESYDRKSLPILTSLNSDKTKVTVFDSSPGSNTKNDIAGSILNFKSAHPNGTVVEAGHSMGADNLVEMVKENPKFKVDTLITVDIASPTIADTDIPSTVPSVTNFRQNGSLTGGYSITAQDPSKTNVQNILVPNSTHTTIDNDVASKVLNMVNNIVNPKTQPVHNINNPR